MVMFAVALVRDDKSLVEDDNGRMHTIMGDYREVTRSEGFAEAAPEWMIYHC